MSPKNPYLLFTSKGCGSVLVEAMLELAHLPYTREEHAFDTLGPKNERIARYNPLGQVPTLVLSDGGVMTESAAIALYLAEVAPEARLAPPVGASNRPQFLRWLVFLVAEVYATFFYADKPEQFVSEGSAATEMKNSIREHRNNLWRIVERALPPGKWFLGEQFSALDVFVAVMTRWTPRREWFAEHCPRLNAIATAAEARPELADVFKRNF